MNKTFSLYVNNPICFYLTPFRATVRHLQYYDYLEVRILKKLIKIRIIVAILIITSGCGELLEINSPKNVKRTPDSVEDTQNNPTGTPVPGGGDCTDPLNEASFTWSYTTFQGHLGFKLYYSTNGGRNVLLQTLPDPTATSTIITGLNLYKCVNTYKFHLTAYTSSQESAPSDIACIGVNCQ